MTPHLLRSALVAALVAGTLSTAAPPAAADVLPPSEWVVGPRRPVVMLTFEGHVGLAKVNSMLADLKAAGARASFFMSGSWLRYHPKAGRALVRAGHELGNRGYGKSALFTELSSDELRASITKAQRVLRRLGATPQPYLRTPRGVRDLRVLQIAGELGYRSVRWTRHYGGGLAKKLTRRVVHGARGGSIIALDPWRRSVRKALPDILAGLKHRGFELRTVRSLENAHPIRWDVTLSSGNSGTEVLFLQKLLSERSYVAGRRDGNFGDSTLQGVYAFEKTNNLARDGVVTPDQLTKLAAWGRPHVPRRASKTFVDIDISRQVLFEVRDGRVAHTIPISSGNEEYYQQDGQTYKAHTPRGDFVIERKIPGWRTSRLGRLYYPSYFVGGFAIHGSSSVPTYPASHGCVRLPMFIAKPFYDRNPVGIPVYVHD